MCSSQICFILVSLVSLLSSLALIVIGTVFRASSCVDAKQISGYVSLPAGLTITYGLLLLALSIFAFTCIYSRNIALLSLFWGLLCTLLTIEIAVGIAGFVMKSTVFTQIDNSLVSAQSNYSRDPGASETWDALQRDFKCCGIDHYDEWFHYLGDSFVPDSCCALHSAGCGRTAIASGNINGIGCVDIFNQWAHGYLASITSIFLLVVLLQIATIPISRCYADFLIDSDTPVDRP